MKVIYIRASSSKGYLRLGLSDGEKKNEYTVSESDYRDNGSPLVGDEIFDVEALLLSDMRYKARLCALRILSFGDNSESTLKRKLLARSISPQIASEICSEMVGLGYLDESRQLAKLIENEANVRLSGKRLIYRRLSAKGYSREATERVLSELISQGTVDFESSKRKLIDKKFPEGAPKKDILALLYKHGYYVTDFSGEEF